jgi:outer membrane cobalamin receptor
MECYNSARCLGELPNRAIRCWARCIKYLEHLSMRALLHPLTHAICAAWLGCTTSVLADETAARSITVQAKRLDDARNSLAPDTGSSVYRFGERDIAALPQGSQTALDEVLLQAPGVVQDSFGQLHVRGDHANVQYRINGIVVPEAISGFGEVLDAAFARQVSLLTGALPAQYGYRTAGVVDIEAKNGSTPGGAVSVYGGSHGRREADANVGGGQGSVNYFVDLSASHTAQGIESPAPGTNTLHDHAEEQRGFAYLSWYPDADNRLSLIAGDWIGRFEIPDAAGKSPVFGLHDTVPPASSVLNARQREQNRYAIAAWQGSVGEAFSHQLALFTRFTDVHYRPDPVGDLVYNGIAADIARSNRSSGLQWDAALALSNAHTVRTGLFACREDSVTLDHAQVFPADADGKQTSDLPIAIADDNAQRGRLFGLYAQDEWRAARGLTVNYGLRFDRVAAFVDEQQWSPRFGLVYQSGDTTMHIGFARYFTPPPNEKIQTTTVQKFLGTTNALPSDANTSVSAERSSYYDVGLSQKLARGLTVGVDAYLRVVRNLQDEGQFGNALIFSPFNYARGRVQGLELSANYRGGAWSGYLNASVSRAEGREIVSGQYNFGQDELDYIASHWVHLDHDQRLAASGGVHYQAGTTGYGATMLFGSGLRKDFANTGHLPAYTQFDLGLTQAWNHAALGKLEGRLAVVNLFDRSYLLRDGSGIGVGAPQYGPRRGFYLGLTKVF